MAEVKKNPWVQKQPPTKSAIEVWFSQKNLSPHSWSNSPADTYEEHNHLYTKVLFCLSGSITFKTAEGDFELRRGDQLIIPAGVKHSAVVGQEGVTCIEAQTGKNLGD